MYKPTKTKISTQSYNICNAIANEIGGEFKVAVPLVKTDEDLHAFGDIVIGSGNFREQFYGVLVNRIGDTMIKVRNFENKLARFKKGILSYGDTVQNIFYGLADAHAYEPVTQSPGDCFAVEKIDIEQVFHPLNSLLVYKTGTNENALSTAFIDGNSMYAFIEGIVRRLVDSANLDEWIQMKYVIARAILSNPSSIVSVPTLSAENSDAIVTTLKEYSSKMEYMAENLNPYGVPTHTPKENQVFFLNAKSGAVIDTNSLAMAFNLQFRDFIAARTELNTFGFTEFELERLNHIMAENVKAGVISSYTPLTEAELAKLEHIVGAIADEDFFVIYDKLVQMTSQYDPLHLTNLSFYHKQSVMSFNPYANVIFFSDEVVVEDDDADGQ